MFNRIRVLVLSSGLAGALFHCGLVAAGPVNINTADATTLARELKGIGLKRAQAIVDYRGQYGLFRSADELALVKGIGPKAIEANRADIRVEPRPASPAPGTRAPVKPGASVKAGAPVKSGATGSVVPRTTTAAK
jgi:competence protein ComEA